MAPRSPSLAFAPTPALEHNNFSSFNGIHRDSSMNDRLESPLKEVRFEEPRLMEGSSVHSRHSIATSNVPLLPPVSSASQIPKQSFRVMNPPSQGVDITAYFEQCRNINEQLRHTHEQERKAWEIERTALKTRIADLELRLNKASGGRRRLSNESHHANFRSVKPDFAGYSTHGANGHRHNTFSYPPFDHPRQEHGKPVWEPQSPLPATRVFSHDDADTQHLPSISEDGPAEDSDSLSPQTSRERRSIPIQEIDSALDGITIRSEGVRSSFHKIMSPIIVASPAHSASPNRGISPDPPRLQLDSSALLDPLDAKLKRNAGHTPLAFDGTLSEINTTGGTTPQAEEPKAPVPSARPPLRPSENSNSYFSTNDYHAVVREESGETEDAEEANEVAEDRYIEPEPILKPSDDDKPLTGPLMLDKSGKSEASHVFLDKLDERLEEVVRRSLSSSPAHSPRIQDQNPKPVPPSKREEDDMPMLRLKQSTNFGSAYGARKPGTFGR